MLRLFHLLNRENQVLFIVGKERLSCNMRAIHENPDVYTLNSQASKYLKIGTCPASQKILTYMFKNLIFTCPVAGGTRISLINTSAGVLFSSPKLTFDNP